MTNADLSYDEEDNVESVVEKKFISEKLLIMLQKYLSKREFEIMCMRYGLDGKPMLTQQEVADKLGISRSYISRLEKKSLECLRRVVKFGDYR